jgi:stress-induced-phosphoprotein 1
MFYKEKKFAEAHAAYDEAIALDPANMMFLNNKAAVYIETGDIDTAIACCNNALEIGRQHRAAYEDKAKVYQRIAAAELKRNNILEAIKAYEKAQMEHADKAIQKKMKDLELEYKKQQKLAYINPALAVEAKDRGNVAFREGNYAKAIEEYEEAIKRDPSNASYHNNLAVTFCKTNLWNDAKREVEKCLEIDDKFVKAWAKKGDIELFFKEYHKALDSYKTGLQLDPENAACKEGLAKTYQKINSTTETEEDRNARVARAQQDPEIVSILNDPAIRRILQDAQEDPKAFQQAYNNPTVRSKIDKLIAAGVLKMG